MERITFSKFKFWIAFISVAVTTGFGQRIKIQNELQAFPAEQVTITAPVYKCIYYLFRNEYGDPYVSTTLPTMTLKNGLPRPTSWFMSDNAYITIRTDNTSAAGDSLLTWIKPLCYNDSLRTFVIPAIDSLFVCFKTVGTYTSTSVQWLDWTDTATYGAMLDTKLWPTAGFAFYAAIADTPGSQMNLTVNFINGR